MIDHQKIGAGSFAASRSLHDAIKNGKISLAGNWKLKIYGKLDCRSGKRMKVSNRVFFKNEQEALQHGYRPCGHCMREAYLLWKKSLNGQ